MNSMVACAASGSWASLFTAVRAISEILRIPCFRHSSRKCSYSSEDSRKLIILLLAFMDIGGSWELQGLSNMSANEFVTITMGPWQRRDRTSYRHFCHIALSGS